MSGIQVKIKKGQRIETALRILKKRMDREGVMQTIQDKRYYKKPSLIKKEKKKLRQK